MKFMLLDQSVVTSVPLRRTYSAAALFIAILWLLASPGYGLENLTCSSDGESARHTAIRVAVFEGDGVGASVKEVLADLRLAKDLMVDRISVEQIQRGHLVDYDVLVFPGGSGSRQGRALESEGRRSVREFTDQGHGVVGICAGAYLVSADYEWSLSLLDAKVLDKKHWARGFGNVTLTVTGQAESLLARTPSETRVYYHQGPLLAPAEKPEIPDYEEWAVFATEVTRRNVPTGVMPGTTAVAAGRFGTGRVVAVSPHYEKTDGSDEILARLVRWAAGRAVPTDSPGRISPEASVPEAAGPSTRPFGAETRTGKQSPAERRRNPRSSGRVAGRQRSFRIRFSRSAIS